MKKGGHGRQHTDAVDNSIEGLVNEFDQIIKDDGRKGQIKRQYDQSSRMRNIPINAKLTGCQRVLNQQQAKEEDLNNESDSSLGISAAENAL